MAEKMQIERIKSLIDQYLEIVHSERNEKNKKLWKTTEGWNRDMWRGSCSEKAPFVPRTIAPDNSFWGKIFNKSLVDYYTNPYEYLEMQLMMKIYHYNNFNDNTAFTDELFIWFGVVTELSFFGSGIEFFPHKEAWINGPIISSEEDIDRMPPLDFYKSGLMPRIHQFYEVMNELAGDKLKVMFPDFVRGPFCIATHLMGYDRILLDVLVEPKFVNKLLRFIVDQHKVWTEERNRFMQEGIRKCKLYNDEIDCPSISPTIYNEIIFPYEKELAEYHGGVSYWHSCGNTSKFYSTIIKLPGLDMLHVGPFSSYKEADSIVKGKIALDICLDPAKDIMDVDAKAMRAKLKDIMESCKHGNFTIRADALMPYGDEDISFMLSKIKEWGEVSAELMAVHMLHLCT